MVVRKLSIVGFMVLSISACTPAADTHSWNGGLSDATSSQSDVYTTHPVASSSQLITMSQNNALRVAKDYLRASGFSRAGLIEQLSSNVGAGFSLVDSTWAVDQLHADWKAQAVRTGKTYLEISGFSRSGLIEQLTLGAGFTQQEATYAANSLGLTK
jgi:hypothetical protein